MRSDPTPGSQKFQTQVFPGQFTRSDGSRPGLCWAPSALPTAPPDGTVSFSSPLTMNATRQFSLLIFCTTGFLLGRCRLWELREDPHLGVREARTMSQLCL